jgi:acyl-CoA dehydrogenase
VITGKKIIALAITEPWGGSDVAQVRTTAVSDGDYFVVSGEKKFITSGMTCHYFTTAVRTDPTKKGFDGISLLLIPADLPGIVKTKIKTQGWWAGNTALINFENVRVPKKNLIGKENHGFRYIMENFNHERWSAVVQCASNCHMMIGECIKYARNRHTFGQPLIKSQVIRHKIANMAMRTEALFAFAEQLTYLMSTGTPHLDIGGRIAMGKVLASQTLEYVAREASQIFGGNSYMRNGPGAKIERMYREVRVVAIGGGSEEILTDLSMRMAKL